jgi:uncharacterized protein YceK
MRYRVVVAVIVVPVLAGCGAARTVTAPGNAPSKRANPVPSIRAACPKSDRDKPVSRIAGADAALVPGHPRVALLCRYSGLNARKRFALIGRRTIANSATVTRIAHDLGALRPVSGVFNCPADFGDAVIAFFEYPTGPADPVTVGLSGCGQVTNGHVHRLAGPAKSPVVAQLKALTPH